MNEPTAEQIAKLPVWARSYIQALCYKLEQAESQLTDCDNPDSIVYWSDGTGPEHGLPPHATIEFKLKSGDRISIRLRSERDSVNINGSRTLSIFPGAANSFDVRVTE